MAAPLAAVLLLAGPVAAQTQPTGKVYRIGFVQSTPASSATDAFRQGLKEAGYVEGKNLVIETRFADGRPERIPELVAEVLGKKVDVLVVISTAGALAARKATTTIPVVFANVADPVGSGIVASLARPGGNLTGTTMGVGGAGFGGKWVELLKEAVPGVSNVAVLWNPANPGNVPFVRELQAAARPLKVTLDLLDAANAANLEKAFAAIGSSSAQGIIVTGDPFFTVHRDKLVRFAASKRLPAMYFSNRFTEAGGLMAYGASSDISFRKAATYVDRILKGAKPADLPVEQPTTFELAINLKTAKTLGLTIKPSLLMRADHLIE